MTLWVLLQALEGNRATLGFVDFLLTMASCRNADPAHEVRYTDTEVVDVAEKCNKGIQASAIVFKHGYIYMISSYNMFFQNKSDRYNDEKKAHVKEKGPTWKL